MNDIVLQRISQIVSSQEERPVSFELAYKLAKEAADGGGDPDKLPWLFVRMFSIFEYGREPQDVHEGSQPGLREEGVPKGSPILHTETAKTLQRRANGKSESH